MTRTSIGAYKVIRRLADEDALYLARSVKGRRCRVRLLTLPSDGRVLEELARQTSEGAKLDHPAAGEVLDWFDAGGELAVVLEAMDGQPLTRLIERLSPASPLAPIAVWYIGYQLAGALAQAHAADDEQGAPLHLCHGHVAPAQVLVGYNGFVRLDGIGLAPLVAGGAIAPPPAYTAPEQRDGGRVTPRGDAYALAALLWALLRGRAPGPAAPSVEAVRALLPAALPEVLGRALQPTVSKRRITAMELEQCLGDLANQQGRAALASAMAALRRGAALFAASRSAAGGGGGGSAAPGGRRPPIPRAGRTTSPRPSGTPVRRKRPLFGSRPAGVGVAGEAGGDAAATEPSPSPSAVHNLDWLAASESVAQPSVPPALDDEITWGEEDELPTPRPAAPGGEDKLSPAAPPAPLEDLGALAEPPSRLPESAAEPAESAGAEASPGAAAGERAAPADPPFAEPRGVTAAAAADAVAFAPPAPVELESAVVQSDGGAAAPVEQPAFPPPAGPATVDRAPQPSAAPVAAKGATYLPWPVAAAITLATAALTLVVGIWWTRRNAEVGPAPTELASTAPLGSAAPPRAPSARASAHRRPAPRPHDGGAGSAAPVASSEHALAASGPDPAALPPSEGYLLVHFSGQPQAEVYVRGRKLGRVDRQLRVPCASPVFVRVAAPVSGGAIRWLTAGRAGVKVGCRQSSEITMKP